MSTFGKVVWAITAVVFVGFVAALVFTSVGGRHSKVTPVRVVTVSR